MKKQSDNRNFSMSYPALMQLGDKAVSLINRDAAELAIYGIDGTVLFFINTKTQELKDFPTDDEFLGAVTDATEIKDALADQVKVAVRSIMVRAKNGFGEGSGKYNRFGTLGMNNLSDIELLQCGKRVVRMATLFLPLLAAKGLTQQMINDLATSTAQFDNAIDAQDDAVRLRDSNTAERAELGNLLYNKIVEVFEDGKDYWFTRNEAKYNDYVLYTGGGSPPVSTTNIVAVTNQTSLSPITVDYISRTAQAGEQLNNDWGDGNESPVTMQSGVYTSVSHSYNMPDTYTLGITDLPGGQPGGVAAIGELRMNLCKLISLTLPTAQGAIWLRNLTAENNELTVISIPETQTGLMILKLSGNKLTENCVNALLIRMNGFGTNGGTIDLSAGTNAAPTAAGLAAKNALMARGWTVVTN